MYTIGLAMSYGASRLNVTLVSGLPGGTYDHYFSLFLPVSDVLWSYVKVLTFAFVII
jgi:phospholipid/cholesterol/gamma-HCH transport system permease protein